MRAIFSGNMILRRIIIIFAVFSGISLFCSCNSEGTKDSDTSASLENLGSIYEMIDSTSVKIDSVNDKISKMMERRSKALDKKNYMIINDIDDSIEILRKDKEVILEDTLKEIRAILNLKPGGTPLHFHEASDTGAIDFIAVRITDLIWFDGMSPYFHMRVRIKARDTIRGLQPAACIFLKGDSVLFSKRLSMSAQKTFIPKDSISTLHANPPVESIRGFDSLLLQNSGK